MTETGGIPGLHRRICRSCGEDNLLTDDVTTPVSIAAMTTRLGRCVRCGSEIRYSFRTGDPTSTTRDAATMGGWFSRLLRLIRRR